MGALHQDELHFYIPFRYHHPAKGQKKLGKSDYLKSKNSRGSSSEHHSLKKQRSKPFSYHDIIGLDPHTPQVLERLAALSMPHLEKTWSNAVACQSAAWLNVLTKRIVHHTWDCASDIRYFIDKSSYPQMLWMCTVARSSSIMASFQHALSKKDPYALIVLAPFIKHSQAKTCVTLLLKNFPNHDVLQTYLSHVDIREMIQNLLYHRHTDEADVLMTHPSVSIDDIIHILPYAHDRQLKLPYTEARLLQSTLTATLQDIAQDHPLALGLKDFARCRGQTASKRSNILDRPQKKFLEQPCSPQNISLFLKRIHQQQALNAYSFNRIEVITAKSATTEEHLSQQASSHDDGDGTSSTEGRGRSKRKI